MGKSYAEMTPSERIKDRIAKSRKIDQRLHSGNAGLSLDGIVVRLDARKQRATYGAVAELVGVLARGLMSGRPKDAKYSWVVAGTNGKGSKRGWPTGYSKNQIHPDCYAQACSGADNIIDTATGLEEWLRGS